MTLAPISSDDPVGNPGYYNASAAKKQGRTEVRAMFLGGPLDHALRFVPCEAGHPDRPSSEFIRVPVVSPITRGEFASRDKTEIAETPELLYRLHRVDIGFRAWFCYILEGHTPSRSHLLDTNPYPF